MTKSEVDPRWGIVCNAAMVAQLELAEEEYICGEKFDRRQDGSFLRLYPSVERVALKYGIPPKILAKIAVNKEWDHQRDRFALAVKDELRSMQAKVKAIQQQEMVDSIDGYIRKCFKAIEGGDFRFDSINDLDKAIRLREFVLGKADSKTEHTHLLSLAEIQARHRAALQESVDLSEATGVVIEEDDEIVGELESGE